MFDCCSLGMLLWGGSFWLIRMFGKMVVLLLILSWTTPCHKIQVTILSNSIHYSSFLYLSNNLLKLYAEKNSSGWYVDSMWGRFFKNAELERMVDQDLTRLYPEHGSYFQTSACQGILRRILLLWCLRYPDYGYRQGLLNPLDFTNQVKFILNKKLFHFS